MLRQSLIVVCMTALSAAAAPAGELKCGYWPASYVPQELADIPVIMDVGFWVHVLNQDEAIKLRQVSIHEYEGCLDLEVLCNFQLTLSCSITPTDAIEGEYSCSIQGADIDPPQGIAKVCAQLRDANLGGQPGGTRDVQVATVTIRVVPR